VGANIFKNLQIEGELSYDFNQFYREFFSGSSGAGNSGTIVPEGTHIKVLHGLVGPKFQSTGRIRIFATVKAGVVNFRIDPPPSSLSALFGPLTSNIENIRASKLNAAIYPGAGVEAFIGPVGLRIEFGDEMFFAGGVHHNWKATFGPQIRF
jgi:hypothetical protein